MNFAVTSALRTFTIFGSPATATLAAMLRKNGRLDAAIDLGDVLRPLLPGAEDVGERGELFGQRLEGHAREAGHRLRGARLVTVSSSSNRGSRSPLPSDWPGLPPSSGGALALL